MSSTDASEQATKAGPPPRVFVSYSDDSPAHAKRVLELAQWLRSHGVDAQIDQFEESPDEGWPRWIYRQIREAEFVLVIATPGYLHRCEADEPRTDATGSATKFGSHLTLQELHEAGGRNRKFIPVLFGGDAIVESVPLPLRGATCYRLPDQRVDLYRRLTGQPKVQRVPLGVLKTFDDESFGEGEDEPPLVRGRASLDEQRSDDSLRAVVDAGIVEPSERERERERDARGRRRARRNRQWLITIVSFGAAFMAVGLWMGQRVLGPDADPTCRIQLTNADGSVVQGIDRVDLTLPSGHLIEVIVEDGRTLRFACPPDRVQAQAHVYLDQRTTETATQAGDPPLHDGPLRLDGRVELGPQVELGGEIAKAKLNVVPTRATRIREPESVPKPEPEPTPIEPKPIDPAHIDPVLIDPGPLGQEETPVLDGPGTIKQPIRSPKVTPVSKNPELQTKLAAQTAALRSCYERALVDNPALRGDIIGDVRIDDTGKVVDFTLVNNQFTRSNPEIAACIRKEIQSWKLGKPKNQATTVDRISIAFSPPAI